jgi:hypothetical protein
MTLDGSGNLAISGSVTVPNTISIYGLSSTGSPLQMLSIDSGDSLNLGANVPGYIAVAGGHLSLDPTGNLTIAGGTATKPGGGSWTAPSDAALKSTMNVYASGLTEVIALEPITYRYSGVGGMPTDEEFIGLDAAATAKVMPELVGADSWNDPNSGERLHYSTVDSGPLIYALVNAVKELAAQNAALEARIAALEARG